MEKKKNIILVLLFIVIGVLVCFTIKTSLEVAELKQGNKESSNTQESTNNQEQKIDNKQKTENNNKNNEVNQELPQQTKKELLELIGFNENGHIKHKYDNYENCIEYGTPFLIDDYYIQMETNDKEVVINEMPISEIKKIIKLYANTYHMYEEKIFNDSVLSDMYDCLTPVGACDGVSFDNYQKIAKKVNLSNDGKRYFDENEYYNNYYLYSNTGGTSATFKIEDNYSFEIKNDRVILYYNINGYEIGDNEHNSKINKKVTYTFKQYEDGTYYLYSVNTINLQ